MFFEKNDDRAIDIQLRLVTLDRGNAMAAIIKSGLMRMNAERDQRSDRIADRIRPAHAAESDSGNQHRRNQRTEKRSQSGSGNAKPSSAALQQHTPAFIAVQLPTLGSEPASQAIKVEIRKGALTMNITWPGSASLEFASWAASILQ